jgi:hypothetical protein
MSSKKSKYAPLSAAALQRLEPYRELMGKRPDGEVAQLAGMDRRYVVVYRTHNGIPAFRRGGNNGAESKRDKPKRFRRSRLDEFRHLMGQVPDGSIAELAGCSREAVMRYRKRHGIDPAPRGRRAVAQVSPTPAPRTAAPEPPAEAAPAPVAEPAPAQEAPAPPVVDDDLPPEVDEVLMAEVASEPEPIAEREGYVITVRSDEGEKDWFLLATDLTGAARKAIELVALEQPDGQIIELRYCADLF